MTLDYTLGLAMSPSYLVATHLSPPDLQGKQWPQIERENQNPRVARPSMEWWYEVFPGARLHVRISYVTTLSG
jgi:hypothetical protein